MKNQESLFSIIFAFLSILLIGFLSGSFLLGIIILILIFLFLSPLLYPILKKSFKLPDLADQVFYAKTEDNWYLALHYHEARYAKKKALPVVLVHGVAQNKFALDLDEFHSLAVYLKVRGFPVFVVSLRGSGISYYKGVLKNQRKYFSFDEHVLYDAPAIIKRVLELTQAPALNWIGFSLGGMIGYGIAGLGIAESKKIQSLITLGSPGKADYVNGKIIQNLTRHPWINKFISLRTSSRLISPIGEYVPTPFDKFLFNPKNTKRKTIQKLLANCIEPINQGLVDELTNWAKFKKEVSADKTIDYRKNLENIKIPTLIISGSIDHIAPPPQVRFAYDKISSKIKKFVIAGKRYGFKEDYGHLCLTVGEFAPEEIFPIILDWLEKYGTEKKKRIRSWVERFKRKLQLRKILKKNLSK
ncbi:MAG: alpha/beta fold hydrolase [Leptonema sp. (in: bacteria)]